ncbi:MAG: glycosyltransferase [Desulfobulbaceae bacterium]|nr:glycosyltransferase [Desulfobulbaceae bacterium]
MEALLIVGHQKQHQTNAHTRPRIRKRLYAAILTSWLVASTLLWHQYSTVFNSIATTSERVLIGLTLLFLSISWLYGFYHLFFAIFSLIHSTHKKCEEHPQAVNSAFSPVAILQTICDDFNSASTLSCLAQSYSDYHVFLLDDSRRTVTKIEIDDFSQKYSEKVTVIRRPEKAGFKAGNLNHALGVIPGRFSYIAIADSDTLLPNNFITHSISFLESLPELGYVQAIHHGNRGQHRFAEELIDVIRVGWMYYQPLRNEFGLPLCYGHGAVIRRSVLDLHGFFPEVVSEDIALSLELRRKGVRGAIHSSIICGEDYPNDYYTFRKRISRWVTADSECFDRHLFGFLRSRDVSLVEKLDALFRGAKVPVASLSFPFLLLTIAALLLSDLSTILTWPIVAASTATIISPYLCFIFDLKEKPLRLLALLSRLTFIYLSTPLLLVFRFLEYRLWGRSEFFVTGTDDREVAPASFARAFLSVNKAGYPFIGLLEVLAGLSMIILAFPTSNFALAAIGCALGLAPLGYLLSWENRLLRWLVHIPFILIVFALCAPLLFGVGSHYHWILLAILAFLLF